MLIKMRSNRCDKCGANNADLGEFAEIYRMMELRAGRPHPGNKCGKCAAEETVARIAANKKSDARKLSQMMKAELQAMDPAPVKGQQH